MRQVALAHWRAAVARGIEPVGRRLRAFVMPLTIKGHIISGLGAATNLIELQKPLLRNFFPEIDNCKIGTINIQLENALDVRIPDVVTPPITWQSGSDLGERFGFTEVEFEVLNERHRAWIYGAEFSAHRFNYMLVEVVAHPIDGIAPGLPCALHLGRFTGYIVV
jgi:hypothetical protein